MGYWRVGSPWHRLPPEPPRALCSSSPLAFCPGSPAQLIPGASLQQDFTNPDVSMAKLQCQGMLLREIEGAGAFWEAACRNVHQPHELQVGLQGSAAGLLYFSYYFKQHKLNSFYFSPPFFQSSPCVLETQTQQNWVDNQSPEMELATLIWPLSKESHGVGEREMGLQCCFSV